MSRNDDYLAHYGVLGMKWGVRRYQNPDGSLTSAGRKRYGATSSDSNVTKKVKKDLASLSGSEFRKKYGASNTTYMKRVDRYGDPYMNTPLAKAGKALEKQAQNDEENKSRGLTDKQKTYLKIGAAAVATGLAVYGGYKLKKHLDLKKSIDMVKDSKADLIKKVNPNFGTTKDVGAYMNCGNCTIAYDLQKRGIDAKATYNAVGMLPSQIGQFYEGLHSNSIKVMEVASDRKKNLNSISRQMINAYPEGSSGNAYLPMDGGFNHFISWSIENGKAIFEDPQNPSADVREYFKSLSTTTSGAKQYGIRMTRLDDLKPITENIKSVVKTGDISNLTDQEMYSDFNAFIQKGEGFVMNILG